MNLSLLQLLPYTLQLCATVLLTLHTAVLPELTQASGASNGLCQTHLGRAAGKVMTRVRYALHHVCWAGFGLG